MASGKIELYTTDFALEAQGASYKGLIVVNKVVKTSWEFLMKYKYKLKNSFAS